MTEQAAVYILTADKAERTLPHSIQVTRNAKGDYQWEIKLYFETGDGLAAVPAIAALDADLRDRFLTTAS